MITLKARRKIQVNGSLYAPKGPCECALEDESNSCNQGYDSADQPIACTGETATNCQCNDNKYCGRSLNTGACSIPPELYEGEYLEILDSEPVAQYLLSQGFVEKVEALEAVAV